MPLQFNIQDQNGQSTNVDVNGLTQQLQAAGTPVQDVSPDGMTLTLMDQQGPYQVSTQDVLKQNGWNITGVKPLDADYSLVDPGLRAAVAHLPDPLLQQEFLAQRLQSYPSFQQSGQAPQVIGAGRDWYVFNPSTSQWVALTNSPDWDLGDVTEGVAEVPRLGGSILGGTAGVALGGGTPASALTGGVGAAAGGLAGDVGVASILEGVYPEYEKVANAHPEEIWKQRGYNAGFDALGGAFGAVPKVARAVASPKVANAMDQLWGRGPISSAVKGVGTGLEAGGGVVGAAAKTLDNPMGRALATGVIPGLGDVQAAGFVAQAPGALPRFAAKGMGAAGESEFLQGLAPGLAKRARAASQNILRTRPGASPVSMSERFAEGVRGGQSSAPMMPNPFPEYSTRPADIYGNMFEGTTRRLQGLLGLSGPNAERRALLNAYKEARTAGIGASEAKEIGNAAVNDFRSRAAQRTHQWGQRGEGFGRRMEQLGRMGRFVERGAENVTGIGLKGARIGAGGARFTGRQLRRLGTINQPFEMQELMRFGAEEAYPRRDTLPALEPYANITDGTI